MRIPRIGLLALLAFATTIFAGAQGITTGTVSGAVADPSGAVIPGAVVELTNQATGVKSTQSTATDGTFKFSNVPIGAYKGLITAGGFSNLNVDDILVTAGATTNLNQVKLSIGAVSSVEVNASAASLLETADSQVTTSFDSKAMQSLPLNNGFDTVTEVIPGIVSTGSDNFSNANGDNFSANGQSGRYNNFEIDGQSNNDNSIGGPQAFFGSQDAIQEIQVITNDFSAQYGRNAGAVVNYITKSGTNSFHGSGFDFYQSEFLSSMTNSDKNPLFGYCPPGVSASTGCAAPVLPRYVENRFGATVGGPLLRDKLFFFFSTYWDRVRQGASPSQSFPDLTPDSNGLATIASNFAGDPGAATIADFGPYALTAGSPQAIGVPAALCPLSDTYTAAGTCLESVTDGLGNSALVEVAGVQRTIPSLYNDQEELGRLDWQATTKDRFFLRYYYQPTMSTGVAGNYTIAAGDYVDLPASVHSVGADWTHTFSSRFVDQLRYSFQQSKVYFQGGAYPNCTATDLGACPAQMHFSGTTNDSAFGGDYLFPQGRTVKVSQVQDNATFTHGNHTLLFGGEFDYQNSPNVGLFFYNGYSTYGSLSNLLGAGDPSVYGAPGYANLADGNPVIPFTEPDVALYAQDDWKILPTLTLHVGVRWEFFDQAINKLHDETVARESSPATAFWSTALPLSTRTTPLVNQVYTNFEPRIGLAYNPDFDKKLVIRAGYAINANPAFYNMANLVAGGAPVTNSGAFLCGSDACLPSNGSILGSDYRAHNLPSLPTGGDPGQDVVTTVPKGFRTPYVQTYTLGVDHQLGSNAVLEVRYVGSKTTDDFQSIDSNPFLLPVAEAFPNVISTASLCSDPAADGYGRPDCNYSNVSTFINGGWASYNALELNLTTRNYHGLSSIWSYTRSKNLNNVTDAFRSTGGGGSTIAYPQNPLAPSAAERGLSGNDFPNIVGIGFDYDLPKFIKGESLLGRAVNGFELSGIYRYRSGQDYTPYQPIDLDPNTGDESFCDGAFNAYVIGVDTCRPVLSSKSAPIDTVAYLNPYVADPVSGAPTPGTPHYIVYNSDGYDQSGNYLPGTATDPTKAHWIINNQAYAQQVNNPYPGSSRSLLRGQAYSDLDLTVTKTFAITERVSTQLSLAAYNALNQMYLGAGNPSIASSNFTSNAENSSGSVSGDSSGNRFVILGGKIIF